MGLRVLRDVIVVYPRKPNPLGLALNGSTRKVRIKACIQPNKPTNNSNTHNEQRRTNDRRSSNRDSDQQPTDSDPS